MTTVASVEDDAVVRRNLTKLIGEAPGYKCICACSTAEEALETIPKLLPEVVVMDIHLPGASGIECTARLKRALPKISILMLTVYGDNDRIFESLRAGASGYLLKRSVANDILQAIADVKTGGSPMSSQVARKVVNSFRKDDQVHDDATKLSEREREILSQLANGYSNKEIAEKMFISVATVKTHLCHIFEKLHVRSRAEAIVHVQRKM